MTRPWITRKGSEFWFHTRSGDMYEVPSKRAAFKAVRHALIEGTILESDRLLLYIQVMMAYGLDDEEVRPSSFPRVDDEEFPRSLLNEEILFTTDEQLKQQEATIGELADEIVRLYESGQTNAPTM